MNELDLQEKAILDSFNQEEWQSDAPPERLQASRSGKCDRADPVNALLIPVPDFQLRPNALISDLYWVRSHQP